MVLDYLISMCGFVGGWLLVAGPVWQAFVELREQELDREAIEAAKTASEVAPRFSPWWWLLPPVAYVMEFRRGRANRRAFSEALPPEARKQTVDFLNKANGWVVVALGAYLFAIKETYELIELIHFPIWVFWVAIVVLPILALVNAALRIVASKGMLDPVAAAAKTTTTKEEAR